MEALRWRLLLYIGIQDNNFVITPSNGIIKCVPIIFLNKHFTIKFAIDTKLTGDTYLQIHDTCMTKLARPLLSVFAVLIFYTLPAH
jgi:hypothetical protein